MKPAPVKEGKILADLNTHPGRYFAQDKIIQMLSSPGLVGLAHINGENRILTYEEARTFPGVREIDRNMLAEITIGENKGYFCRGQKVIAGFARILALGFKGSYFPDFEGPKDALEEIHQQDGLAILLNPYMTRDEKARITKSRLINDDEKKVLWELCGEFDEIEVFSAQNVRPLYGIILPKRNKPNSLAEELAVGGGQEGISSSGALLRLEQEKIVGIYLDEEGLCMDKIKEDLKEGNFERFGKRKEGPYVSRWSFLRSRYGL